MIQRLSCISCERKFKLLPHWSLLSFAFPLAASSPWLVDIHAHCSWQGQLPRITLAVQCLINQRGLLRKWNLLVLPGGECSVGGDGVALRVSQTGPLWWMSQENGTVQETQSESNCWYYLLGSQQIRKKTEGNFLPLSWTNPPPPPQRLNPQILSLCIICFRFIRAPGEWLIG